MGFGDAVNGGLFVEVVPLPRWHFDHQWAQGLSDGAPVTQGHSLGNVDRQ